MVTTAYVRTSENKWEQVRNSIGHCGANLRRNAKTTICQLNHPIVHINGSISIRKIFLKDLESDKKNLENKIEKEIEKFLVSNTLVSNASVYVTDLEITKSLNRKKRSGDNILIGFVAEYPLGIEEHFDLIKTEDSLCSLKYRANSSQYDFFDKKSFDSLQLSFEVPIIKTIQSKSKDEITEMIGKIMSKILISHRLFGRARDHLC